MKICRNIESKSLFSEFGVVPNEGLETAEVQRRTSVEKSRYWHRDGKSSKSGCTRCCQYSVARWRSRLDHRGRPRGPSDFCEHAKNCGSMCCRATQARWWVLGIAFLLNRPLPLLPLHILFLRPDAAVTASFLTVALAHLWHVFHMRDRGSSISRNDITTNRYVWHALCLCVALLLAAVCLRRISIVLKLSNPSKIVWLIASGLSLMPVVFRILLGDRQEQKADRKSTRLNSSHWPT